MPFPGRQLAKAALRALWKANGRGGPTVPGRTRARATVLITYFDAARLRHLDSQVRNVLRCRCVDRLVLLNHNPDLTIDPRSAIDDRRLEVINATERRGCGSRWPIAVSLDPDLLLVLDDDLLLFSWQVSRLVDSLSSEPGIPHGLSGMEVGRDGSLAFHQRENRFVDLLCEAYAITGAHLGRYVELAAALRSNSELESTIASSTDFVLVSRAGTGRPRIHDLGWILRCDTSKVPGVAVHKRSGFADGVLATWSAVNVLASARDARALRS